MLNENNDWLLPNPTGYPQVAWEIINSHLTSMSPMLFHIDTPLRASQSHFQARWKLRCLTQVGGVQEARPDHRNEDVCNSHASARHGPLVKKEPAIHLSGTVSQQPPAISTFRFHLRMNLRIFKPKPYHSQVALTANWAWKKYMGPVISA